MCKHNINFLQFYCFLCDTYDIIVFNRVVVCIVILFFTILFIVLFIVLLVILYFKGIFKLPTRLRFNYDIFNSYGPPILNLVNNKLIVNFLYYSAHYYLLKYL